MGSAVLTARQPNHRSLNHGSLLSSRGAQRRGICCFYRASAKPLQAPPTPSLVIQRSAATWDLLFLPRVSQTTAGPTHALSCHPEERSDVGSAFQSKPHLHQDHPNSKRSLCPLLSLNVFRIFPKAAIKP